MNTFSNQKMGLLFVLFCALGLSCSSAAAIEVGKNPPDFRLQSNQMDEVSLSKFKGRVIYVDFWASWCAACAKSLAWLEDLQQKYGEDGFQVIAVNLDEEKGEAHRALEKANVTKLLVGYDPKGNTPESFDVQSMPSSYLIDRSGALISVYRGTKDSEKHQIEQEIQKLL